MRNSFIFYSSYYDAISELPEEEQGLIYKAIIDYAIAKKEPKDLTPACRMCFKLIRPTIDAALSRYDASVENGKKGGAPKGNSNAQKQPRNNLETTQEQPRNNPDHNLETSEKQAKNNLDIDMDIDLDIDMDLDIDKNKNFKKESKNVRDISACVGASGRACDDNISKPKKLESYEQIMDDFCVKHDGLREALFEFIRHCQLNGRMVTNEKLKNLILRLDFAYPHAQPNEYGSMVDTDVLKMKAVKKAINSGFFDIPELRDGI